MKSPWEHFDGLCLPADVSLPYGSCSGSSGDVRLIGLLEDTLGRCIGRTVHWCSRATWCMRHSAHPAATSSPVMGADYKVMRVQRLIEYRYEAVPSVRMEGTYISSYLSVPFISVAFRSGRLSVYAHFMYYIFGVRESLTGHVICL